MRMEHFTEQKLLKELLRDVERRKQNSKFHFPSSLGAVIIVARNEESIAALVQEKQRVNHSHSVTVQEYTSSVPVVAGFETGEDLVL